MSKSETFTSIELADLATVVGGLKVEGEGEVDIGPGTGKVKVKGKYERSNYESCMGAVTSRPGWTPKELKDSCGLPPAN